VRWLLHTTCMLAAPGFKGCVFISIMGIYVAKILVIFAKIISAFT
jgi:hypothetical protein